MHPEELIIAISDFQNERLARTYDNNPEYLEALRSYGRLFESNEIGRDPKLENLVETFLSGLQDPGGMEDGELETRYTQLIEGLYEYSHGHFVAFNGLEDNDVILQVNQIITFLEVERDRTEEGTPERVRLEEMLTRFGTIRTTLGIEKNAGDISPTDFEGLANFIISRYNEAREASDIPERVRLLDSQSYEIQNALDSYLEAKASETVRVQNDLEASRLNITYGLSEVLPSGSDITRLERWGIFSSTLGHNAPDFEVATQMADQIATMTKNELTTYGQDLDLGYDIAGISNITGLVSSMLAEESSSSGDLSTETFGAASDMQGNLDAIFSNDQAFYERMSIRMIEQWEGQNRPKKFIEEFVSPDVQRQKIIEMVLEDFDAFTTTSLRITFNALQEALSNESYRLEIPGMDTIIDYSTWGVNEVPTEEQEKDAIERRNRDIVMSMMFLQRLYREDSGDDTLKNMEFYAASTVSTLWDIYTAEWLGVENETVQSGMEIAAGGVLIHRLVGLTNRLNAVGMGSAFAFQYSPTDPEFLSRQASRENVRDTLTRLAERPPRNARLVKRINRVYDRNYLYSDTTFYSAMEEAYPGLGEGRINTGTNYFRTIVSRASRLAGPVDAVSRLVTPFIPSVNGGIDARWYNPTSWVRLGWTPQTRIERAMSLEAINGIKNRISASNYAKLTGLLDTSPGQASNTALSSIQTAIDSIYNVDPDNVINNDTINTALFAKVDELIANNSSLSDIDKFLTELADEKLNIGGSLSQFTFRNDVPPSIIQAIERRCLEGINTQGETQINSDLNTSATELNNKLKSIIDLEDQIVKNFMLEDFTRQIGNADLPGSVENMSKKLNAFRTLRGQNYRAIRGFVVTSDGINGDILDQVMIHLDEIVNEPTRDQVAFRNDFLDKVQTENASTINPGQPTIDLADTTVRPAGPEASPSGSLIDVNGAWADPNAQMIFEINMIQAQLNGINISQADIDTFTSQASSYTTLDELRAGIQSLGIALVPNDHSNPETLERLRISSLELESRDVVLRSLVSSNVDFTNLQIQITPNGKISYSYDSLPSTVMRRTTEIANVGPFYSVSALTAQLTSNNGGTTIPSWDDLEISNATNRRVPDIEATRSQASQRTRILEFIRKFR